LNEALPIPARIAPEVQVSLRGQIGDVIPAQCAITWVYYMGDEGAIVCKLDLGTNAEKEAFTSITHLRFDPRVSVIMACNVLNRRMVIRVGLERMLLLGASAAPLAGLVLALDAVTGWGGVLGLVVPLFAYVSMAGLIIVNSVAGALGISSQKAGAASALVGSIGFGMGVLGSAMVGWLSDGTPSTIGWMVGASGIGSVLAALALARTREAAVEA
jgi:hypothetical protein